MTKLKFWLPFFKSHKSYMKFKLNAHIILEKVRERQTDKQRKNDLINLAKWRVIVTNDQGLTLLQLSCFFKWYQPNVSCFRTSPARLCTVIYKSVNIFEHPCRECKWYGS